MKGSIDLLVVSRHQLLAAALQRTWQADPDVSTCAILGPEDLAVLPPDLAPDVVVLAPLHWEEMLRLLQRLPARFPSSAWLVVAELRIAGMFLLSLEPDRSTIFGPDASPVELQTASRALIERRAICPQDALDTYFRDGVKRMTQDPPRRWPRPRALQIGCALSLGVTNSQIATHFHLTRDTVKGYVTHLLHDFPVASREALGAYVEEALTLAMALSGPGVFPWPVEVSTYPATRLLMRA